MFETDDIDLDEDLLRDLCDKESQYYSQQSGNHGEDNPAKRPRLEIQAPQPSCSGLTKVSDSTDPKNNSSTTNLILEALKKKLKKTETDNSQAVASGTSPSSNDRNSTQTFAGTVENREKGSPDSQDKSSTANLFLETLKKHSVASSSKNVDPRKISPRKTVKENVSLARDVARKCGIIPEAVKKYDRNNQRSPRPVGKPSSVARKFPGPAGLMVEVANGVSPPIFDSYCLDDTNDSIKDPNDSNISEYWSQATGNLFSKGAWRLMLNDLAPNFLDGCDIATIKHKARQNKYENYRVPLLAGMVRDTGTECDIENPSIVLNDLTDTIGAVVHSDVLRYYPNVCEPGVVLLLGNVGILTTGNPSKISQLLISPVNIVNIYTEKGRAVDKSEMEATLQRMATECVQLKEVAYKSLQENSKIRSQSARSTGNIQRGPQSGSLKQASAEDDFCEQHFNDEDDEVLDDLLSNLSPTFDERLQRMDNSTGKITTQVPIAINKTVPERIEKAEVKEKINIFECDDFDLGDDFDLSPLDVKETMNPQNQKDISDRKSNASTDFKKLDLPFNKNVKSITTEAETKTTDPLETLKKFMVEPKRTKKMIPNSKQTSIGNPIPVKETKTLSTKTCFPKAAEGSSKPSGKSDTPVKGLLDIGANKPPKIESPTMQLISKPSKKTDAKTENINKLKIRSKLAEFRSKEVMAPEQSENLEPDSTPCGPIQKSDSPKGNIPLATETPGSPETGFAAGLLSDSDPDPDDDILSQLDIDSIVASYNKTK